MQLSTISKKSLFQSLAHGKLKLKVGHFNVCLSSSVPTVADHIFRLYDHYDLIDDEQFIDFFVSLAPPNTIRRFFRPQINFSFDGYSPFRPLPYSHASALFEWGLNWCIASQSQQYLIIHAAVVEKNNQAFIFAGTPGSGKSTLCAGLVCRGWRLLSDEMTLVSLADGLIYPVPRPVSLKNQSLDVIKQFSPDALMGPIVYDTSKGTVGHMRPPNQSVELGTRPAVATKLILPKYQETSSTELTPLSKGKAFIKIAENCFNYHVLGGKGFNCLGQLCDAVDCYEFKYSNLNEAVALFSELAE